MGGHRRSTRLADFDYRWGSFFVSIVAFNREPIFGTLVDQTVQRSRLGDIVAEEWLRTAAMRPSVQLDEWIVMPDHFQAILIINENILVGGARGAPNGWQRNYHDRIIRNIVELNHVRRYIRDNPKNAHRREPLMLE